MTVDEIMQQLKEWENESSKKIFLKHGAKEPFYAVKVADLKKIQKKVKKNHELALELYDTGVSDAMYLAGLIAEPEKMTKKNLQDWLKGAYWYMLSEYTVAWITAASNHNWDLALKWIDDKKEQVASAGWATISSILSVTPNEEIDAKLIMQLLKRVEKDLHDAHNRVRYTMNGFVIAAGAYMPELTEASMKVADKIGKVHVDMGGTACKVPPARPYIQKIIDKGYIGKKRKTTIC